MFEILKVNFPLEDKIGIEPICLPRPRRNRTVQAITLLYHFSLLIHMWLWRLDLNQLITFSIWRFCKHFPILCTLFSELLTTLSTGYVPARLDASAIFTIYWMITSDTYHHSRPVVYFLQESIEGFFHSSLCQKSSGSFASHKQFITIVIVIKSLFTCWWVEMESNHPSREAADLQSAPLPLTVYLPIYKIPVTYIICIPNL